MLSRVAENLYWISRYVERAENVTRLLEVAFHLELDAVRIGGGTSEGERSPSEHVLAVLACRNACLDAAGSLDRDAVLRYLTFDRASAHSISSMIGRARENARATQETLSGEAWGEINRLHLWLSSPEAVQEFAVSPTRCFDEIKQSCALFGAFIENALPRAEAYYFLQLGRFLERANQIARALSVTVPLLDDAPANLVHWSALLQVCSATEAYLREHQDRIDPPSVVRFLVLGADFPRTISFCVARCCESVRAIAGRTGLTEQLSAAERRLGRLESELRYLDVGEVLGPGLAPFLSGIQQACTMIGTEIQHTYFFS